MQPMSSFDPKRPSMVHDRLNDKMFVWDVEWAEHFGKYAVYNPEGTVEWDGLMLDGWHP
jgi:hypothetical protein